MEIFWGVATAATATVIYFIVFTRIAQPFIIYKDLQQEISLKLIQYLPLYSSLNEADNSNASLSNKISKMGSDLEDLSSKMKAFSQKNYFSILIPSKNELVKAGNLLKVIPNAAQKTDSIELCQESAQQIKELLRIKED